MKRILSVLAVMMLSVSAVSAQKIGYLNMETVLEAVPEYVQAQEVLKQKGEAYRKELETEYRKIEEMYQKYQSEKAGLSSSVRQARENEIILKERELKEKNNAVFGKDGRMAQESRQLLDPVTMKVQAVIDAYAAENGYSLIIDVASLPGAVYISKDDDLSSVIIKKVTLQ